MRALLDTFAPDLGSLACDALEMAPAYARFWEPETCALLHDVRIEAARKALVQKLREHTQALVARGGPSLLVGRYLLHDHTAKELAYGKGPSMLPHDKEPYYPLAAVLALFGDGYGLNLLQKDWEEALRMEGPLPLYLHATGDGHYTAMLKERVVLDSLVWL